MKKLEDLSDTTLRVFSFVMLYFIENKISPSLTEIAKNCKLKSFSSSHFHIQRLCELGYFSKIKNINRSILINEKAIEKLKQLSRTSEDKHENNNKKVAFYPLIREIKEIKYIYDTKNIIKTQAFKKLKIKQEKLFFLENKHLELEHIGFIKGDYILWEISKDWKLGEMAISKLSSGFSIFIKREKSNNTFQYEDMILGKILQSDIELESFAIYRAMYRQARI